MSLRLAIWCAICDILLEKGSSDDEMDLAAIKRKKNFCRCVDYRIAIYYNANCGSGQVNELFLFTSEIKLK